MASVGTSRRWIVGGLVVLGIVAAAIWPRSCSDDADEEQDSDSSDTWVAQKYEGLPSTANRYESDGGVASRRIADDCDPVAESMKYEGFIGTRARAMLSWNKISAATADLKIPVDVVSIENGAIGVRFHHVPMSQQFIAGWLHSGHIRTAPEGLFLLDPCSATIVEWLEKSEGMAEDDREDEEIGLDDDDDPDGDGFEDQRANPAWPSNVTIPSKEELEGLSEALNEIGSED